MCLKSEAAGEAQSCENSRRRPEPGRGAWRGRTMRAGAWLTAAAARTLLYLCSGTMESESYEVFLLAKHSHNRAA
jgi:hypothetical protein